LINGEVPSSKNGIQDEAKNKLKYKTLLSAEVKRMWNMKCFVLAVFIGATGIVTKGYHLKLWWWGATVVQEEQYQGKGTRDR
jgi:hypothetical protein